MRITKEQKEQENIISDRNMRDKCVGRYDVLEKVKKLLLLPGTDLMSIDQVADYYEVSSQGIKNLYSQNREEIDGDGTKMLPRDFYNGSNGKSKGLICSQYANKVTGIIDMPCPSPADLFRKVKTIEE